MTTQTQIRRGTATACDAIIPAEGEMLYDMTNDRMRIGDGLKLGGWVLSSAADVQNGAFNTFAGAASGNDYTMTVVPDVAAYAAKQTFVIQPSASSTGGSPIRVRINALSYVDVYKISGGAVVVTTGNEWVGGGFYTIRHDGTHWVQESSGGDVASVSALNASLVITPTSGAVVASVGTANTAGVGSYVVAYYNGSSTLASGATTAGSNLVQARMTLGVNTNNSSEAAGLSGTWRNVGGASLIGTSGNPNSRALGTFIRVS